jgi:hypothetical protein
MLLHNMSYLLASHISAGTVWAAFIGDTETIIGWNSRCWARTIGDGQLRELRAVERRQ